KTVNQIAKSQKLPAKHINQRFFDPSIFLEGDLAAMLIFATNKKSAMHHPDADVLSKFLLQDSLVAGAGFEPAAFRL
ncbi:hypothetical protein, partial [Acetobacter senegalensis]|uniref:hypothetical protein n=1 Tax=Acetobacter senegalensis TaxID=446692 RepID=UPI001EE09157